MKQALRRGEEEAAKVIALENKFFVPPITSLIVVQPCEKDHAGHLADPEQGRNQTKAASKEEEPEVAKQINPSENTLDNTEPVQTQNYVETQNDGEDKTEPPRSTNNGWDRKESSNTNQDESTNTKPSSSDYFWYSSHNHNQNHNQNHNHNNNNKNHHNNNNHNNHHNNNHQNHNLNRWDYPDYPKNDVPCKLVLYSRNLGKGQKKEFWKSERVLGDFSKWAWSGQAEGACCWRLFDKPNFSGARVDLKPGKLYR